MPPNVRARSLVHPFLKTCSTQWNRRRSTNPAWTDCVGKMSARIGIIRLSARTMAGAHITEATPPTKRRLRVSIEPPNTNMRYPCNSIVRGQVSHHDRMPVILEPEEFELVAHRARPGYPGSGRELTKRRRDSTRAVTGRASAQPLGRKPQ